MPESPSQNKEKTKDLKNSRSSIKSKISKIKLIKQYINKEEEIKNEIPEFCSLCIISDERLAFSRNSQTIKIFNLSSFNYEFSLKGHKDSVSHISLLDNGSLLSSSFCGSIKIWEIKRNFYNCILTLVFQEEGVLFKAFGLSNNRIFSSLISSNNIITILNDKPSTENLKTVLVDCSLMIDKVIEIKSKNYMVFAKEEKIYFFDNHTFKCKKIILGAQSFLEDTITEISDDKLIIGENERMISIINLTTLQLETKVELPQISLFYYSLCDLKNNNLLVGFKDQGIIQIETNEWKVSCLGETEMKRGIMELLVLNNNQIISCNFNNVVELWEVG